MGEDQELYENIVHGLRSKGWSRFDAEGEALERIERKRSRGLKVALLDLASALCRDAPSPTQEPTNGK